MGVAEWDGRIWIWIWIWICAWVKVKSLDDKNTGDGSVLTSKEGDTVLEKKMQVGDSGYFTVPLIVLQRGSFNF